MVRGLFVLLLGLVVGCGTGLTSFPLVQVCEETQFTGLELTWPDKPGPRYLFLRFEDDFGCVRLDFGGTWLPIEVVDDRGIGLLLELDGYARACNEASNRVP